MTSLLRADREITEIYGRNVDTVYRVCYSFMRNKPEAEDMTQETFLRLIASGKAFENQRHEKAWSSTQNWQRNRPRGKTPYWMPFSSCPWITKRWYTSITTRAIPPGRLQKPSIAFNPR